MDYCKHCGAGVPPRKGEGTCPKCTKTNQYTTGYDMVLHTDLDVSESDYYAAISKGNKTQDLYPELVPIRTYGILQMVEVE